MQKGIILVSLVTLMLIAFNGAGAQTIRGTVVDSTGMPLHDVRVSVMPVATDSTLREARTGNTGDFALTLARPGRYRVRLNRIGYAQQTSAPLDLSAMQIVTLRFTMHVAARQLAAVTVVERRNVTLTELMSASGFDIRQAKYPMYTMGPEQLANEGVQSLETLFRNRRFFGVEVQEDSSREFGESLKMRSPPNTLPPYCNAEVYLDGVQINDSHYAFNRVGVIITDELYGVEVYRGAMLPPASLGGMLGTSNLVGFFAKPCGAVAVWTKIGRERAIVAERVKREGSMQVIRGTVVDFDTGKPVANPSLTLYSEYGAPLEKPVTGDSSGAFIIRSPQYQKLRLDATASGYVQLMTPAFNVEADELITVQVILSPRHQPIAPVAIVSRELPRNYTATDRRGFSFRRRRALGGAFFDTSTIARSGASSIAALVRGVANVRVPEGPDSSFVVFTVPPTTSTATVTTCRPMYFLNGELQRDPDATVRQLALTQLDGLEVFPLAAEVPYVYRAGSTGCGVIVVWTK